MAGAFDDPNLQKEYESGLAVEQVRLTRVAVGLGTLLNVAFVALDIWAVPSALYTVWSCRVVMNLVLLACLAATWREDFLRWYPLVTAIIFLTLGGGVTTMIYVAEPSDFARDAYYGGLVLTTYGVFSLSFTRLRVSLGVACALLIAYTGVAVFEHDYLSPEKVIVLVVNLFFLVAAMVLGVVAQAVRDRYSRENYLLRHALERDVELQKEAHKRASFLADHDALTGLSNRRQFERRAARLLDAQDDDLVTAVLFIDLDKFKPINDEFGHAAGDRVLKVVAERLVEVLRAEDVVARLGGDEFVICARVGGDVAPLRKKVADAIGAPISVRGGEVAVAASVGVAVYAEDGVDIETLILRADEDMYAHKNNAAPLRLAGGSQR